jgi:TonB family protein
LYDATLLLDAKQLQGLAVAKGRILTWPVMSLIAMTFCATLILGLVAINYLFNVSSNAPPDATQRVTDREPTAIVKGLNDKDAQLPSPEYPARARMEGVSGKVTVAISVDSGGSVTSVRVLDGHPLFQASALEAAKKAKFSIQPNQPGPNSGTITYFFK